METYVFHTLNLDDYPYGWDVTVWMATGDYNGGDNVTFTIKKAYNTTDFGLSTDISPWGQPPQGNTWNPTLTMEPALQIIPADNGSYVHIGVSILQKDESGNGVFGGNLHNVTATVVIGS